MRGLPLLISALVTLALAGCMHRQQAYYIVDPATGQPVPVVQHYQPQYAQQGYAAPPARTPTPAADTSRGLFSSSPIAAQQSYAAQPYAQQAAAPAERPPQATSGGRGLFNSSRRATSAYAAPGYQPPTYTQPQTYTAQPYPPPQPQYAQPQYAQPRYAAPAQSYAYALPAAAQPAYTLDSGDKLRVVVFGQDGITNSYIVGADGNVNLPLVGSVPARGLTTRQLSQMIAERLKQGYVREPHVSVEVETYRPFFILGEVTTPGQYPFVANMTAETAVAIAGGFSPRADKSKVELTHNAPGQAFKGDVPLNYPVRPGDTVVVKERWF